ncbi:UNKNOWN [Stylonychia lemnae]|uniref:Uncharacterized protein n=1 Tax=Stylonychia lemnae TaxID=5949 RepID=A0A078B0R7_STYLE|nr:UNKNOWN [Stylonychia lemnae]|eukprot:CDW86952.1 UNKNOWN [Stylonychia lemnae]
MEEDYQGDPFNPMQTKEFHPFFYLALSVAYNLAKLIIIVSIIYYFFYLLFHKNNDNKRRNDNRAGFMENLFTTGDFQKDVLTLKNTLINTKISHIEHIPKDKDKNQTSSGSKSKLQNRRVTFNEKPEVFLLM